MKQFCMHPVGTVRVREERMCIEVEKKYIPCLRGLKGFSHAAVFWWFSDFDTEEARSVLEVPKPYKNAPEIMGIFSIRSPIRPNPIALSVVQVLSIDYEKGAMEIAWIDAHDSTPVVDIKPYTPSMDRVESPSVPDWCGHWPKSIESSGDFNWENEFTF